LFAANPVFTPTQEITGNNAYSLAGHGDTTWVITDRGCNCAYTLGDSLVWFGYKSDYFNGTLAFGNAHAMAGLLATTSTNNAFQTDAGKLWLYTHATKKFMLVDPGFFASASLDSINHDADFSVHDVAWSSGAFWVAAGDGELVRVSIADTACIAFMPGTKIAVPAAVFIDSVVKKYGSHLSDTLHRAVAVEVQDTSAAQPVIWLATPAHIWKFTLADTSWDSLPVTLTDTGLTFVRFQNVFTAQRSDSARVYASIITALSSSTIPDTALFRYSTVRHAWIQCSGNAPTAVTFGDSGYVYVVAENQVQQYEESGDSLLLNIGSPVFRTRMTKASGGNYPDYVNDMLFLRQDNDSAHVWIASS
jgi:hypothetical protein